MPGRDPLAIGNLMQWDRACRGHHELWAIALSDPASQTGITIHYTVEVPRATGSEPRARIFFAAFNARAPQQPIVRQRSWASDALHYRPDPFELRIADCLLRDGHTHGALQANSDDSGSSTAIPVSWDLRYATSPFVHYSLPESLYSRPAGLLRLLTPHPLTHFSGTVALGDRVLLLDQAPGQQSHAWGARLPASWAWGYCGSFNDDPTAALELVSLQAGNNEASRRMTSGTFLSLYLGPEVFHFRAPWTLPLTSGRWTPGSYTFDAVGQHVRIQGEISCAATALTELSFNDPNGAPCAVFRTAIANASVEICTRRSVLSGFRHCTTLTARGSAHLETGARSSSVPR